MAISKSMDSPIKKNSYAAQVEQSTLNVENSGVTFLPVPGPQGERGPKGDKGDKGDTGETGPKGLRGDSGKDGKDGKNGLDGKSMLSPSGQMIGWGYYKSKIEKNKRTGINEGEDGWVSLNLNGLSENSNENYLPIGNVSLWNNSTNRINLRTLKLGSIVTICYNFSLSTHLTNTEVWVKTFIGDKNISPVSYVGNLKYQYDYEFTVEQKIFIDDVKIKNFGAIPQMRTDNSCDAILKSIFISVS